MKMLGIEIHIGRPKLGHRLDKGFQFLIHWRGRLKFQFETKVPSTYSFTWVRLYAFGNYQFVLIEATWHHHGGDYPGHNSGHIPDPYRITWKGSTYKVYEESICR